ncbi:MAG: hypothetical protein ACYS9X_11080 [Planctomycetota bacterium]
MKRPTPREVAFIVAGIPGVALLFLPFVWGVVPVWLLAEETSHRGPGEWPFKVIVAVALLAVPILASSCRQAMFGPLTRCEVRAAYALAFGALAATAFLMLAIIDGGAGSSIEETVIIPSTIVLAVGAAIVLVATRKGRVPPDIHAHVAMLVAWMPNAAFCLFGCADLGNWGAGFYVTIVAFVAYAVEAVVRVRRALRGEVEGVAEGRHA